MAPNESAPASAEVAPALGGPTSGIVGRLNNTGALAAYLSTSRRETVPGHRDWIDEPLSCITPR